jgi:hypothetical protein
MKFLKILILGPLSILSLKSTAQVEDVVEGYQALDTSYPINSAFLLKYLEKKPLDSKEETPFYYNIQFRRTEIRYSDSTCITLLKPFSGADTIEVINPVTKEKMTKIAYRCFYVPPIPRFYRAKQVLYYDKKRANFGLRMLAIGLIVNRRDEMGKIIGFESDGWLKPNNMDRKTVNMNDPNITIAKRLISRSNSVVFDKVNILKNTIGDIQQTFIDDLSRKNAINLYGDENDYTKKHTKIVRDSLLKNIQQAIAESKLSKDSSKLVPQKDSLKIKYVYSYQLQVIVDADAFPDFTKMVINDTSKISKKVELDSLKNQVIVIDSFPEYTPEPLIDSTVLYGSKAIYKLKIIQDWYWDEKLNNICVRLFAIAPMKKIFNEAGEFLFDLPLFYRLND